MRSHSCSIDVPPPLLTRRSALLALLLLIPAPSLGVVVLMVLDTTRGTFWGQTAYALSKLWIIAVPTLWLIFVDRGRLSLSPTRHGGLGMGTVLGMFIGAAIIGSYLLFASDLIDTQQVRGAATANGFGTPMKYVLLALYLTVLNSLTEEYVWRWFVFRKCEVLIGGPAAVVASALTFTLHHIIALKAQTNWPITLLGSFGVFVGGCAWSWCYLRYRSIWPGYVSHILADVAVFLVGWFVIFGETP